MVKAYSAFNNPFIHFIIFTDWVRAKPLFSSRLTTLYVSRIFDFIGSSKYKPLNKYKMFQFDVEVRDFGRGRKYHCNMNITTDYKDHNDLDNCKKLLIADCINLDTIYISKSSSSEFSFDSIPVPADSLTFDRLMKDVKTYPQSFYMVLEVFPLNSAKFSVYEATFKSKQLNKIISVDLELLPPSCLKKWLLNRFHQLTVCFSSFVVKYNSIGFIIRNLNLGHGC